MISVNSRTPVTTQPLDWQKIHIEYKEGIEKCLSRVEKELISAFLKVENSEERDELCKIFSLILKDYENDANDPAKSYNRLSKRFNAKLEYYDSEMQQIQHKPAKMLYESLVTNENINLALVELFRYSEEGNNIRGSMLKYFPGHSENLVEFLKIKWSDPSKQNIIEDIKSYGYDPKGIDLRGVDLSGTDLSGVNFQGAKLNGANLSDANLSGAILKDADLSDANLSGAKLCNTNIVRTNFTGANLHMAKFENFYPSGTIFDRAILLGADLGNSDFMRVSLKGANLRGTNWGKSKLEYVDFSDADLSGANLSGVSHVREVSLANASLKDAILEGLNIVDFKLSKDKTTRATDFVIDTNPKNKIFL